MASPARRVSFLPGIDSSIAHSGSPKWEQSVPKKLLSPRLEPPISPRFQPIAFLSSTSSPPGKSVGFGVTNSVLSEARTSVGGSSASPARKSSKKPKPYVAVKDGSWEWLQGLARTEGRGHAKRVVQALMHVDGSIASYEAGGSSRAALLASPVKRSQSAGALPPARGRGSAAAKTPPKSPPKSPYSKSTSSSALLPTSSSAKPKHEWNSGFASAHESKVVNSLRARVSQLEELTARQRPPHLVHARMLILQGKNRTLKESMAEANAKSEKLAAELSRVKIEGGSLQRTATKELSKQEIKVQQAELRNLEHELKERQQMMQLSAVGAIAASRRRKLSRRMAAEEEQVRVQNAASLLIQAAAKGYADRRGPIKEARDLKSSVRVAIHEVFEARVTSPTALGIETTPAPKTKKRTEAAAKREAKKKTNRNSATAPATAKPPEQMKIAPPPAEASAPPSIASVAVIEPPSVPEEPQLAAEPPPLPVLPEEADEVEEVPEAPAMEEAPPEVVEETLAVPEASEAVPDEMLDAGVSDVASPAQEPQTTLPVLEPAPQLARASRG